MHVPTTVVVVVDFDVFRRKNSGSSPPYAVIAGIGHDFYLA